MSRRRINWSVLAVIVGACFWTGAVPAPGSAEEPEYFYYGYEGEKVRLWLARERIHVLFEKELPLEQKAAILAAEPDLEPVDEETLEARDRLLVTVKWGRSADTVLGIIDRLSDQPGVQFAFPVFKVRDGRAFTLTEYFYAVFPAETPEEDIDALNAEHHVVVVKVFDYSETLGKVAYRLKVTKQSGMNTLDLANLYHEHPLTLAAEPTFAYLEELLLPISPRANALIAAGLLAAGVILITRPSTRRGESK